MSNAQGNKKVTIYCDKSNSRGVIRKIGFRDAVWMDDMKTGTYIDFIEHSAYLSLQAENERLAKELINLSVEHPCYRLSKELEAENEKLKEANKKLREGLQDQIDSGYDQAGHCAQYLSEASEIEGGE